MNRSPRLIRKHDEEKVRSTSRSPSDDRAPARARIAGGLIVGALVPAAVAAALLVSLTLRRPLLAVRTNDPTSATRLEPTQGVDVGARADIYNQIRSSLRDGAAAIIVSSDFDELLLLADRIVVLCAGRVAGYAPTDAIDRHWLAERVYAIPEEVPA